MCQPPAGDARMGTPHPCSAGRDCRDSLVLVDQEGAGGSEEGAHGTPKWVRDWIGKQLVRREV